MSQFYRVQQFWPHNQCSPTHKVIALGLAQYIGEFFQGGFFSLEVVTFFVTLRADLEDYFKCKT